MRPPRAERLLSDSWFEAVCRCHPAAISTGRTHCLRRRIRQRIFRPLLHGPAAAHSQWPHHRLVVWLSFSRRSRDFSRRRALRQTLGRNESSVLGHWRSEKTSFAHKHCASIFARQSGRPLRPVQPPLVATGCLLRANPARKGQRPALPLGKWLDNGGQPAATSATPAHTRSTPTQRAAFTSSFNRYLAPNAPTT